MLPSESSPSERLPTVHDQTQDTGTHGEGGQVSAAEGLVGREGGGGWAGAAHWVVRAVRSLCVIQ